MGKKIATMAQTRDHSVRLDSPGRPMVCKVAREGECEDMDVQMITIFRDRTKNERKETKKLIAGAAEKNRGESNKSFKWIIDYEKIQVLWVEDHHARRSFRDRKYR